MLRRWLLLTRLHTPVTVAELGRADHGLLPDDLAAVHGALEARFACCLLGLFWGFKGVEGCSGGGGEGG